MNISTISIEEFKALIPTLIIEEKKNKLLSQDEVRQKAGYLKMYRIGGRTYFAQNNGLLQSCIRCKNDLNISLIHVS